MSVLLKNAVNSKKILVGYNRTYGTLRFCKDFLNKSVEAQNFQNFRLVQKHTLAKTMKEKNVYFYKF